MTNKLTPEEQVRLLRTEALAYGAEDIQAMANRVAALDALYHLDGRHLDGHPLKSTYTGLISSLDENR